MIQLWQSIALIFVGWLLGLLGPTILAAIKKKYQCHEIASAINVELEGVQYRLATATYLINQRSGLVDRELLEWIFPIFENYRGMYANEGVLKSIESQLELNSDQLAELGERTKGDGTKALTLRKIETPFIDLNIANLSKFPSSFQLQILDIRTQLTLFNTLVEDSEYYFKMTFAPDISDENRTISINEIELTYTRAADKATTIALSIDNCINNYKNKICI